MEVLDDGSLKYNNKSTSDLVFCQYLEVQWTQPVAKLLKANEIGFEIIPFTKNKDVIFDLIKGYNHKNTSQEDAPFHLFVDKNAKEAADKLLQDNPQLFERDLRAERKLFLEKTLDVDGVKNIVIFPEKWDDLDVKLAKELITEKNIVLEANEIAEKRNIETKLTPFEKKNISRKNMAIVVGIILFIIYIGSLIVSGGVAL